MLPHSLAYSSDPLNHLSVFFGVEEPAKRSREVGEVSIEADIEEPLVLHVRVLAVIPGGQLLVLVAEGPTEHCQVMAVELIKNNTKFVDYLQFRVA